MKPQRDRMLTNLRYERTKASNSVRWSIRHMEQGEAPFLQRNGLPSWWPFWSDVLKKNVVDAVRAARRLDHYERTGELVIDPQVHRCGREDR
jgi:hypothetical protein